MNEEEEGAEEGAEGSARPRARSKTALNRIFENTELHVHRICTHSFIRLTQESSFLCRPPPALTGQAPRRPQLRFQLLR